MKPTYALYSCILFLYSTSPTTAQSIHSIPDPNLRTAIQQTLEIEEGPITKSDMERLTKLEIPQGPPIRSLEGLEAAKHLEVLSLGDGKGQILEVPEDFSPIAGLKKLRFISVTNNGLKNINLPDDLPALIGLAITDNLIESIDLPKHSVNLSLLSLRNNKITHIEIPGTYSNLDTLTLMQNPLGSILLSPNLPKLELVDLLFTELKSFKLQPFYTNLKAVAFPRSEIEEVFLPRNTYGEEVQFVGIDKVIFIGNDIQSEGLDEEIVTWYDPILLTRSKSKLELTWQVGNLYSSSNISGPWTPVEGITSPHQFEPSNPSIFFRLFPGEDFEQ